MSVRIAQIEVTDRGFTLLAEQDAPVSAEEFDRLIGRPREMGRWFDLDLTWPTCPNHQLEVGSAVEFTVPVGPLTFDFILIVADRVPGESLLFRTTRGSVDLTLEYSWVPSAGGVTVSLRVGVRVRGSQWWKSPWTRSVARRRVVKGLENMRQDLALRPRRETVGAASSAPVHGVVRGAEATGTVVPVVAGAPRPVPAHRKAPQRRRPQRA